MATEVISTIKPAGGGDYTSIQSWEAAGRYDLVAADEIYVGEVYSGGNLSSGATTRINFAAGAWVTDATRRIVLRPGSGEELSGMTGRLDTSQPYALHSGSTTNILYCNAHNVSVKGIQFESDTTATAMVLNWGGSEVLVENCVFYWDRTGTGTNTVGLLDVRNADCHYRNCTLVHEVATSQTTAYILQSQSTIAYTCKMENCTGLFLGSPTTKTTYGVFTARNGVVLDCTNCYAHIPSGVTNEYQYFAQLGSTYSITTSYCSETNANATVDEVTFDTSLFLNVTIGTLDLTPASGSALLDVGTTIGTFSEDINGLARPSGPNWDIGAIERDAPVSISPTGGGTVTVQGGWIGNSHWTPASFTADLALLANLGPTFGWQGMAFKGKGGALRGVMVMVGKRLSSSTFDLRCDLYATTGTYGTNATPTGSPLASSNTIQGEDIGRGSSVGTYVFDEDVDFLYFEFPTPVTLTYDTVYCFLVGPGLGSISTYYGIAVSDNDATYDGNRVNANPADPPTIFGSATTDPVWFKTYYDGGFIEYIATEEQGTITETDALAAQGYLEGEAVSIEGIWNAALTHLGAPTVSSTSDSSEEANLLNEVWEQFFEKFLTDHSWNGAKTTLTLSQLTDSAGDTVTPPARWSYAYALPSDFLMGLRVNGHAMQPQTEVLAEVEAIKVDGVYTQALMTNQSECDLEYIFDVGSQVTLLKPQTRHACGLLLAAYIAPQFGKSEQEIEGLRRRAELALADARAIDSQENTPQFFAETPLLRSRSRWRGRRW